MGKPKIITLIFLSLLLVIVLLAFGLLFTMKMTALSAGYVNSRIDSLPLASHIEQIEHNEIVENNPELVSLIEKVINKNEVELKEQIKKAIYIIYDYLNGKSEELHMVSVLKDTFLEMESDIPPDIAKSLADIEEALSTSRQYIGYFNVVYGILIGFIVLLIAGIILIYREVKSISRILGGIFLGFGIVNLIAIFIIRSIMETRIAQLYDVPSSMRVWLTQLATGSLTPLLILAIVILVIGAALLFVFFIYKRNQLPMRTLE